MAMNISLSVTAIHNLNLLTFSQGVSFMLSLASLRDEWPSGLYSVRQVTEVKLGVVRSDSGWMTSEA